MKEICITLTANNKPYGFIALTGDETLPAIGGVRILNESFNPEGQALVMALAKTMYRKAENAKLPLSGGKALLYLSPLIDRATYLKNFAKAINDLNGRYITAVDIGSTQKDMDFLAQHTPYVTCHTAIGGDPSALTARTVLLGIQAACKKLFSNRLPEKKRIFIQGMGKVGQQILQQIHQIFPEVSVFISDTDTRKLSPLLRTHQATVINPNKVYDTPCDIFISAANSYLIDSRKAKRMNCTIFAAAANNPFASSAAEKCLIEKGCVLLPDYLINSGGLIHCAFQYGIIARLENYIESVYHSTSEYLARSLGACASVVECTGNVNIQGTADQGARKY